jgi:hypothetical protein
MRRRLLYGWFDADKKAFKITKYPPDAPIRPSLEIETMDGVDEFLKRARADVYWWPPLPDRVLRTS